MRTTASQSLCGEFSWRGVSVEQAITQVLHWNGRVDNRDDLWPELLQHCANDAAIVLAAYERWGVKGFHKIVGDWSVVIFDASLRMIILASDFAGVRPLYYQSRPDGVRWSASLGRLVVATGASELDTTYIAGFLTFGGYPDRTPYVGIRSVPAGHAVCVSSTRVAVHAFWDLPTADEIRYRDELRYEEQFRALFRESVAVRLATAAPVIAELSGGLDSSSVVCLANRLIQHGVVAARDLSTVSFVHKGSRDLPFIREVEAFCDVDGVHLDTQETPLVASALVGDVTPQPWIPLMREVARLAHQRGAKVILTGQNGDLVTGNWFDDSLQVARPLRRGHIAEALTQSFAWSKVLKVPAPLILARALKATLSYGDTLHHVYSVEGLTAPRRAETSLVNTFERTTGVDDERNVFSSGWADAPPERRKHFRALSLLRELRTLQRPDSLEGLDYTHPFAHRPLVEFLLTIPADVLCQAGRPRMLMRRAFQDLWPPALRTRRSKSLFGGPWNDALRPMAIDLLASPRCLVVEGGWVDPSGLTARLERLICGLECNEPQLRQIILLEYWLRRRERQQPALPESA
jgi:asparagine synthase (glutamine-hydrolysing)